MKKPIIGISASMIFEEKDELFLGDKYSCVAHSYVDAIYKSGGIPVVLPILKDVSAIREQVKLLDGIVLSVGRDVDPHFYGEEPLEKLEAIFPERDVHETALIKAATDLKKPIFAICRGMQILNVVYGGTLYQDISYVGTKIQHKQKWQLDIATHDVDILGKDHIFYEIFGEKTRVNSFHHQMIKDVAPNIAPIAKSKDGIVEAFQIKDYPFFYATQWHPEMMSVRGNEKMKKIFEKFVGECRG